MKVPSFTGLLLAPLVPAVAVGALVGFRGPEFDHDTAAVVAFGCIAGGYIAGFCIGWPLLQLWRRFSWTGPVAGGALGLVAAACLTIILAATLAPFHPDVSLARGFLNGLTFTGPVGALVGLSFWWLSMRSSNNNVRSRPKAELQVSKRRRKRVPKDTCS